MTANQVKLPPGSVQEDALENHLQQDETENTNSEHIFQLFSGRQYAKCLWAINVSKRTSNLRIFDASCWTHIGNCEEDVLKMLIAVHAKDPKSFFAGCELGLRHYINGDFEGALEFFRTGFKMHKSRMYQALDCFNNKTSLSALFKQAAGEFKKVCKGCRVLTLSTLIEPEDVTLMNKDLKDLIKGCPHKPSDENAQRKQKGMWLDSDSEEESCKLASDDETLRKILETRNQKEELAIKQIWQLFVHKKYSTCLRAIDATKLDTNLFILKASCMTHLGIQQDKVLQILNNALVRKSKDSTTNYELGLSHYINGDFEEALEFLQMGCKLDRKGMHQALEYFSSKPSLSTLFEQAAAEFTAICKGCRVLSLAAFIHPESPSIMTRAKKLIDSCSHVKAEAEDGELSGFETPISSNTIPEDSNASRPEDLNSNDLLDSFEVKSEHILETSLESDVSLTPARSATPFSQPGRRETQDSLISNGSSSTASEDPKEKPKLPEKSGIRKRRNAMDGLREAPKKIEAKKLSRSFKRPIRLGSKKKEKFKAVAAENVKLCQKMCDRRWALMYPRKRSQFSKIVAITRCIDSDFWDSDSSDEDTKEPISDDSDSDYNPSNPDVKLDLSFYKKNKKRGKAKLVSDPNYDSGESGADNKKARSKKKRNDEPILQMKGFYDESFKLSPVKTAPKRKNKPKKKLEIDEVTYTTEKDMFAAINAQLAVAPPTKIRKRSVGMGKLPPKFEKARFHLTFRQIESGKRLPPKGIFPLLSPVRATPTTFPTMSTSPLQSPTYPSNSMHSAMLPSCSSYVPTTSPPHYCNNWNSASERQTDFESEIPSYLTPNYLDSASSIKAETSISITDVEDELDGAFAAKNKTLPVMAASSSLLPVSSSPEFGTRAHRLANESSSESDEQTTWPFKKKASQSKLQNVAAEAAVSTLPVLKSIDNSIQSSAPRMSTHTENSEDKSAKFEELYDAAFDVTLPSMLWGIHRCPKRKFVVFSKFSETKDTMSIHVKISNNFECTANVNGLVKISIQLSLEQLDVDYVSTILDKLDQEDLNLDCVGLVLENKLRR